ncbi:hypothetical protein [Flavobacterium nitratireducens]|uniref:hypothetical protein n=1 Tax=Flavobacterium nitratireducens TaxID=992289 RepID=UPI0024154EF4|nr:hypothetical protein [Flavobacterium nitratireducens]
MKKIILSSSLIIIAILSLFFSCKNKNDENPIAQKEPIAEATQKTFDSTAINTFFKNYSLLKKYEKDVKKLYQKHQYHYVWYDDNNINEFAYLLYDKINNIDEEGLKISIPYKEKLNEIRNNLEKDTNPNTEIELFHSAMYFFYAQNVYHGLDSEKSTETGWHIPRKKLSYVSYLDSLLTNPTLINKEEKNLLDNIFYLKKHCKNTVKLKKRRLEQHYNRYSS